MKISIIIPAYNVAKYIESCLDSINKNDNIEIIVVNDGSVDKTKDLVEKYKDISLFNNSNHGVSYSRNFGITKATGDYIMFVDSDDILKEKSLDYILDEQYDSDVVYFSKYLNNVQNKSDLLKYIIGFDKPCIAGPYCKLFKRDFILKNNIKFKEDVINGEDMLFNVECALKLKKFEIVNKSIYMYRQTVTSATKTYNPKILESDKKFHIYLNLLLNQGNVDLELQNSLEDFCKQNAIITLLDRMSYVRSYSQFKDCIIFLKHEPYKCSLKIKNKYLTNKSNILMILVRLRMYRICYCLLRYTHKKSKIKYTKDYFIEI